MKTNLFSALLNIIKNVNGTQTQNLSSVRQLANQEIVSVKTLRNSGLSTNFIASRCRPNGPWQRILPGVVQLNREEPTRSQKILAALALLGSDAIITGTDSMRAHHLTVPEDPHIRVLISASRRILPHNFINLERTTRLPEPVHIEGIPYAPVVRATLDAARHETSHHQLHALLANPIRHGLCDIETLLDELRWCNQRGSSAIRSMLRDKDFRRVTYLERDIRMALPNVPIPSPQWNTTVHDRYGNSIGMVNAWWKDLALGWQIETEAGFIDRQRLSLTAAGATIITTDLRNLEPDYAETLRNLTYAYKQAVRRSQKHVPQLGLR